MVEQPREDHVHALHVANLRVFHSVYNEDIGQLYLEILLAECFTIRLGPINIFLYLHKSGFRIEGF